jgi:septal ring-binding cell division protein DamX
MSQIQSTDMPYFLTKQTANLQEDFNREIKDSASLFLLYGEVGVGKTRLLKELVSTRFNQLRVHWVDCDQAENKSGSTTELDSVLERALKTANSGDVIVADHFELATNKMKHHLLQTWATDGIDKKFSLIIATGPTGIEEIRNLADRYSLDVKGFQLLPLTRKEVDGYCASVLFPLLVPSPLWMPRQTRRALNEARGLIGNLRDVVALYSHHIVMQGTPSLPSIVKPLWVVSGLAIILLLAGLTYRFIPIDPLNSILFNPMKENKVELNQPEGLALSKSDLKMEKSQALMKPASTQTILLPQIEMPTLPKSSAELTLIESSIIKREKSREIKIAQAEKAQAEKAKAEKAQAEKAKAEKAKAEKAKAEKVEAKEIEINEVSIKESVKVESLVRQSQKEPHSDWFNAELKRSRDWFETVERSRATIQIMSINLDVTTSSTYFSYLKTLQKRGVDVTQLRVYRTRVPENLLFSIVYGSYSSRRMASRSIINLPSSLGANQPISRSIGGIWDEISQFD